MRQQCAARPSLQVQLDFIEPDGYVNRGYPHDVWTRLRAEAPVYWFDRSDGHDFWAITKHEDIRWISKRPELFISDPTLVVQTTPPQEGADLTRYPTAYAY